MPATQTNKQHALLG